MQRIKYGMVGGDLKALIGEVHRKALAMHPQTELVCGCFSADDQLNRECAAAYGVEPSRVYDDFEAMARAEEGQLGFVAICTPNHLHYPIAKAFLLRGVNVVCEKPLCFLVEEAEELAALAKEKGLLFAMMYTYSGYPMAKVMRELIARGDIGRIVSVHAEYVQGAYIDMLHNDDPMDAAIWRTDPKYSGISTTCADIGSHIENFVHYVTGLKIKRVAATVDRFGKALDLNDDILAEYENGVHGAYWCSQVSCGKSDDMRIRVYGMDASIEWAQLAPDQLVFIKRDQPPCTLLRGSKYLKDAARLVTCLPDGHPEGYQTAEANIYRNIVNYLLKQKTGELPTEQDLDFPTIEDGINGVRFTHAVIQSGAADSAWVMVHPQGN